jgi:Fanconi anemia group M protein
VNLGIEAVEIRTEEDHDVRPYVMEKNIDWAYVDLPESFLKMSRMLTEVYLNKIEALKKWRLISSHRVSKRELLAIQQNLIRAIREGNRKAFIPMNFLNQAIKLEHAIGLLETQGVGVLDNYWKKLRTDKAKASSALLGNRNVIQAIEMTRNMVESGSRHPKISKLCSIVSQQLKQKPNSRIIVFANYRQSVAEIVEVLKRLDGVKPIMLIGQREGLSQKQQIQAIKDFGEGSFNVLVTTSIGEEGLDIPAMDLAVFYEPVPSEIRSIQRRGRVGRQIAGRVIVLITRNTRDEAYFWSARSKEKRMKSTLYGMKSAQARLGEKQNRLPEF